MNSSDNLKLPICGIYVSSSNKVHLSVKVNEIERREEVFPFNPFAWAGAGIQTEGEIEELKGEGVFTNLVTFPNIASFKEFVKTNSCEYIRSFEHQYLLEQKRRLFEGMNFNELKRCQLDIETASSVEESFSNATRPEDRVLAIGLRMENRSEYLLLDDFTDTSEKKLLEQLNEIIQEWDPDVIEGHNIYKFDFDYLRIRAKRLDVPCAWGRFGKRASFRNSRLRVAERWVDFPRCDIPGRAIFDTYLMIQLYDLSKRELTSYSLKSVAVALGITDPDKDERTYIDGHKIQNFFVKDRESFLAYLGDDLRETKGLADFLLPTYFAQVQNFPMTLQESTLRGTGTKVDLILLEKYYHAKQSLPEPIAVKPYAGGFTKGFEKGVFKKVLSFDVSSMYPSLLMAMGRNPKNDTLNCFIPTLKEFREYRLEYKRKAREASDPDLQREYGARQNSFKILINSFYGYLGFNGARFADSDLAAELTAQGRELIQKLIKKFVDLGCEVIEADTDGLYISADEYFNNPDSLLKKASSVMPEGVELEFAGSYDAMFCYKAKNYALLEEGKVIIRGSALRSRGLEPFLKQLTDHLIRYLLGVPAENLHAYVDYLREEIEAGKMHIEDLAKSERLSQNPEAYLRAVQAGSKPRRASLEVALRLNPMPKMGDQVSYYITAGEKKSAPDWQKARPLDRYDPGKEPYDPKYYLKKLNDWLKRYQEFLPEKY